jgi:radical SAM protein with 4Fe4S-binding SPASM domain
MARHAADRGVPRIKISTNGTLLGPEMVERLLASGVTSIRVPLESNDAGEYRAWRGGTRDVVVAGLERLIARRDQLGVRVKIVVATVVSGQTDETVAGVRQLAEQLGADGHELMPNIWADQWPVARLPPAPSRCDQPLATLHVLADGAVTPCCHSLLGEVVLGNVHRQSIEDIWNGAAARRTRADFRADRLQRCGACNFGVSLDPAGRPLV